MQEINRKNDDMWRTLCEPATEDIKCVSASKIDNKENIDASDHKLCFNIIIGQPEKPIRKFSYQKMMV